MAAVSDSFVA